MRYVQNYIPNIICIDDDKKIIGEYVPLKFTERYCRAAVKPWILEIEHRIQDDESFEKLMNGFDLFTITTVTDIDNNCNTIEILYYDDFLIAQREMKLDSSGAQTIVKTVLHGKERKISDLNELPKQVRELIESQD